MWVRLAIKRKKQGENSSFLYQRSFQPTEFANWFFYHWLIHKGCMGCHGKKCAPSVKCCSQNTNSTLLNKHDPSMGKRFLMNAGIVPTSQWEKQYPRETRNFYGNCQSTVSVYFDALTKYFEIKFFSL